MKRILILAGWLMMLSACATEEEAVIPLTESAQDQSKAKMEGADEPAVPVGEETDPLIFAVASILSVKQTNHLYGELADYLEQALEQPVELVQRQTYGEIKDMFAAGEADIGFVCAYLTVIGDSEGIMERLAVPVIDGSSEFESYIIVHSESDVENLGDLNGRRFAFSDPLSYSGYLYPIYAFSELGYDPDWFFERSYYTYSHDNTISAVANGLVDGGATHSHVYDRLEAEGSPLIDRVRIIDVGDAVGNSPFIVHPDLEEEMKQVIQEELTGMTESLTGQSVLDTLGIQWFKEPEENRFEPIHRMMERLGMHDE